MIADHQPTIFGKAVVAALSSVDDGTMVVSSDEHNLTEVTVNRRQFLEACGLEFDQAALVKISYDTATFTRYRVLTAVDRGDGMSRASTMTTDALATKEPELAMFVGLADCLGAILYDPRTHSLMVSHLGRQATEQYGARRSVAFMSQQFGAHPKDILVWLSPAVGQATYPVHSFGDKGLLQVNLEHLKEAGIASEHIEACPVDTAVDERYFSHSQFLQGHRTVDGRFAIAAQLAREQ